jgi:hypothetical protein
LRIHCGMSQCLHLLPAQDKRAPSRWMCKRQADKMRTRST